MSEDDALGGSPARRWIATAMRPEVRRRSVRVSLVVGTSLVAVNHLDHWLEGTLAPIDYLKMLLTYAVPYCVSTWVSVSTLLSPEES
ncbi:MAG: nitrate/nitrite transporter NrtS [Gammaproteobacteria bacterium]|nr:nitrate/nitrite transporter NrtS [Gammaproteobacteria bacterium]